MLFLAPQTVSVIRRKEYPAVIPVPINIRITPTMLKGVIRINSRIASLE